MENEEDGNEDYDPDRKAGLDPDENDLTAKYDRLFITHIIVAGSLGRLSFGFDAGVMSGA